MKALIHIRGSNGSGKTTIVREFLKNEPNEIINIQVGKKLVPCHKTREAIVIGRYDRNECGGVDACIHDKQLLKQVIEEIVNKYETEYLIFEAVMYGKTFKLSYEIYLFAKMKNVQYIGVYLSIPFEETVERVNARNGGKEINIETTYRTWKSVIISTKRLEAAGVRIIKVEAGKMNRKEMGGVLPSVMDKT